MKSILIIDDDDNIYKFLKTILMAEFKAEVKRAPNGLEGLKMLQKNIPDGIILDVSMPVLDGLETIELIRSNELTKDIPVFVSTADNSSETVEKMRKFKIQDYLLKPFKITECIARLDKFFSSDKKTAVYEIANLLVISENTDRIVADIKKELGDEFSLISTDDGIDGLESYLKNKPKFVILNKEIKNIDPNLLGKKIWGLINQHTADTGAAGYLFGLNSGAEMEFDSNYFNKILNDLPSVINEIKTIINENPA